LVGDLNPFGLKLEDFFLLTSVKVIVRIKTQVS
jgi:hypothetical protein